MAEGVELSLEDSDDGAANLRRRAAPSARIQHHSLFVLLELAQHFTAVAAVHATMNLCVDVIA